MIKEMSKIIYLFFTLIFFLFTLHYFKIFIPYKIVSNETQHPGLLPSLYQAKLLDHLIGFSFVYLFTGVSLFHPKDKWVNGNLSLKCNAIPKPHAQGMVEIARDEAEKKLVNKVILINN